MKNNNALVSFVVPCYNAAHFLPACLESLLSQTYTNFELLILDNCSQDNTRSVVQTLRDPRIVYVRNDSNIGHIRNFNKGITMSRGQYVMLVAADDFIVNRECLERYVHVMERHPDAGYVFCRAVDVGGVQLPFSDCGETDQIWKGATFLKRLVRHNCIVMSSVMARRECFDQHGLFSLDLHYASDWYLWSLFAMTRDVAYVAAPMICFRIHNESLSSAFQLGPDPICVLDELNVLGRVTRWAEVAGHHSLRGACKASMVGRAAHALHSSRPLPTGAGLRPKDLETLLKSYIFDIRERTSVLARVYSRLGDEQFWAKEYTAAAASYREATELRPLWCRNVAKSMLLRLGAVGIAARQLAQAIPRPS